MTRRRNEEVMKKHMAIATFALVVVLFALGACSKSGSSSADPAPTTTAAAAPTTAPTSPATIAPTISSAKDLVGDWESPKSEWVVHFKSDGTFVEDFQGLKDFRVGTYAVSGTEVSLVGGDGNADKGRIDGESLIFPLGTLTRK